MVYNIQYELKAKYVIHAVGPRWNGGQSGERAKLASCYRRSLELARAHGVKTIAFPGISTGVYGYPVREASEVAVATIREELARDALPEHVILCTFDLIATVIMNEVLSASP